MCTIAGFLALVTGTLLWLELAPPSALAAAVTQDPSTATTADPLASTTPSSDASAAATDTSQPPATPSETSDPTATTTATADPSTTVPSDTLAPADSPDLLPPVVGISDPVEGDLLSGDVASETRTHLIRGTASDESGIKAVSISIDGLEPADAIIQTAAGTVDATWSYNWSLPAEDNAQSHLISVTATDNGGNQSAPVNVTARVDTLAPRVSSFLVNGNAEFSLSTAVEVELVAVDGSEPLSIELANDFPDFAEDWLENVTYPYSWSLTGVDGSKTVYGRVKDGAGNVSATLWDEITLDTSAPSVTKVEPAAETGGVALSVMPRLTFSDEMDAASLGEASLQLWLDVDGDGALGADAGEDYRVPGTIDYDAIARSASLSPALSLDPESKYFVRVTTAAKNAAGQGLATDFVSSFYTGEGDATPPTVVSVTPASGSTEVSVLGVIRLEFSEAIDLDSLLAPDGFALYDGITRISGQLIAESPTLVAFYPAGQLEAGRQYSVVVGAGTSDLSGNVLASAFTSQLTTVQSVASPHGGYTSSTSSCQQCHLAHGAPEPGPNGGNLLVHDNENALCRTCHDGRGASTDVDSDFAQGTSGHFLEDSDRGAGPALTARCSSCHGAHFAGEDKPSRYRPEINGQLVTGNDMTWCLSCHDDSDSWAEESYPYPSGGPAAGKPERSANDNKGYPMNGTFPGRSAYTAASNAHASSPAMVWPGSGRPGGDCRNCHTSHSSSSPYDGLIATYRPTPDGESVVGDRQNGTYASLCLTCHDGGPSTKNIKQFVTYDAEKTGPGYTGGHRITTQGGNLPVGAPLPCYDCHNPHGSKGNDATNPNKHLVSDEQWSGIDTTTTAGVVSFCTKCHLPWEYVETIGETGLAGTVPAGQLEQVEGLIRWKADNKLSLIPGTLGHSRANMENPSVSCYSCHGNSYASPSATSGFNVHRPGAGQGCIACHAGLQDAGDGAPTRRAVASEFAQGGGHHVDGPVSDRDCGVCHLEGSAASGEIDPTVHKNNAVDLRNPDTGDSAALPAFATFSRDTSSAILEPWVKAVQDNFCMKCHDADGAASAAARTPTGTNQRPFTAIAGEAATDVYAALDPDPLKNGFQHAVRAPGNNEYATASAANGGFSTMEPPWNQGGRHDVISCFDCHETTSGHGGRYGRIARSDIGNPPAAANYAGMVQLCLRCHSAPVYEPLANQIPNDGSRFAGHRDEDHTIAGGNSQGCRACHAGLVNGSGLSANGAPGNIHGGAFAWPAGSPTADTATSRFLYGGYLEGWRGGTCFPGCHEDQQY